MLERIPVTVLTGFLGAGKTTLLNRILSGDHGLRLAVIVNEFGEVGIDHQLVVRTDDDIVEMNNGCICCTVRADLVEALQRIVRTERKLDAIVIETTGLADPAPVVQTFFLEDRLASTLRLDAIVTVVDARHIEAHWESEEAREQIAFADTVLVNKIDLVGEPDLTRVERHILQINPLAKLHRTQDCDLPLERVLGLRAFELSRALALEPKLLEDLSHEHDPEIAAVCLQRPGTLDEGALTRWLRRLGQERGPDLYRLKGILNLDDARRRFVVHGVHMLLDGRPGLPWQSGELRMNQLVFIGRRLDRAALQREFDACFVSHDEEAAQ